MYRAAQLDRLDQVAHDFRLVEPLIGHFIVSAIGMVRSGEMAPRQLVAAVLNVAERLPPERLAWADQLRAALEDLAPPGITDAPDCERPIREVQSRGLFIGKVVVQ